MAQKAAKKRQVNWRILEKHLVDIEKNEIANGEFDSIPAFMNNLLSQYCGGKSIKRKKGG